VRSHRPHGRSIGRLALASYFARTGSARWVASHSRGNRWVTDPKNPTGGNAGTPGQGTDALARDAACYGPLPDPRYGRTEARASRPASAIATPTVAISIRDRISRAGRITRGASANGRPPPLPLGLRLELVYRGSQFNDSDETLRGGRRFLPQCPSRLPGPVYLLFYIRGENLTDGRTSEIFSFGSRGAAVFAGARVELYGRYDRSRWVALDGLVPRAAARTLRQRS
jgi:hypothetical protein